jgi:phage terminase small subunit
MVETIAVLYPPSASHTEMLAMYAQNKEVAIYCDKYLRTPGIGFTFETERGDIKNRPEVKLMHDARLVCKSILQEFGLSPSSQRAVKVEKQKEVANAFSKLSKVG